ncbi:MAG: NAD+ synthase [Candidatus Brocadiia bacterium]
MSLADDIAAWIRTIVHDAEAEGLVLGLSGGIDSAVTAALAQRAFRRKVLGVILPCESEPQDAEDARLVANTLDIETAEADLTPAYQALLEVLPEGDRLARANIKPRLRMTSLYYFAATRSYLVCGASNRTEIAMGYFTKYGDSAVDLMPIGGLLKYEVRELARQLAIPQRIIDKPPSAGLWPGQTDEDELGMSYGQLDLALRAMATKDPTAMPAPALSRVREAMRASEHKRRLPPIYVPPKR